MFITTALRPDQIQMSAPDFSSPRIVLVTGQFGSSPTQAAKKVGQSGPRATPPPTKHVLPAAVTSSLSQLAQVPPVLNRRQRAVEIEALRLT